MSDASRIRIVPTDSSALVRVLMSHEMESGQRKDSHGKPIPAWHIQEVTVLLNGKSVLSAEWGTAVSKNPFWQFTLKGTKAGDRVTIQWKDNRGDSRSDEATIGSM
jgi:sulfur-oxidizing protein SoxZ